MPSDKRQDRLQAKRDRARISPVRSRMLDLYEEDRDRSLEPAAMAEELTLEGWEVSQAQVNYHLRKLQDAELVPTCLGG
jgi:DNA-binding transcriptional ArsR family regulator